MNSEDRSTIDPGDRSWIEKITKIFSPAPKTREDVNDLLEQALENQLLDGDEFTIIEGAMEVTDLQVREVMVARSKMIVVNADETPEQFLPKIIKSGHSRFPVVGETNDDIIGILHAKDLLPLVVDKSGKDFDISNYLRPLHKVPESKRLNKLLKDFRNTRNHMAIVLDEYGSISGLITIEDVLEEIVGEIEDEFDVAEDATIRKLADNDFIIKALTTIEDFNENFDAKLDDTDFDTIGGLVAQRVGHVPQRNETVEIDNFCFKVLHADSRRIHLLRLFIQQAE